MTNTVIPEMEGSSSASCATIGRERLLSTSDICELTGLGEATAATLMKETGRCLKLHGRLYVIESSFFAYLHEKEANEPCQL